MVGWTKAGKQDDDAAGRSVNLHFNLISDNYASGHLHYDDDDDDDNYDARTLFRGNNAI